MICRLIAIMLGRLHMSVDEALNNFATLAGTVFKKRGVLPRITMLSSSRYSTNVLNAAIKKVLKISGIPDNALFADPDDYCRTLVGNIFSLMCRLTKYSIVLATSVNNSSHYQPYLFRSYNGPPSEGLGDSHTASSEMILQAARATTAAPTYFEPMRIFKSEPVNFAEPIELIDGGIGSNNPSFIGYAEVLQMRKRELEILRESSPIKDQDVTPETSSIDLLVSIGSGIDTSPKVSSRSSINVVRIIRSMMTMATGTERVHEEMYTLAKASHSNWYHRFNVPFGKEIPRLDEFEKISQVMEVARKYLQKPEVRNELRHCARILVERRRSRT
jgi:hypothetical protein